MFPRVAIEPIRTVARHFPALLLTGPRQTGKTTLLRAAFPEATYVSFDLPSIAAEAEANPERFLSGFTGAVILDEVQYVPDLFRPLKAVIDADRHRNGRFLMTGSQKPSLMDRTSESLAGRVALCELPTLSADEIHRGLPAADAPSVPRLLYRGGYPELWRDPDLPERLFFSSYVATYLERDVRTLLNVGRLRDFERFLRACALRSAQLLNLADLARDVGIAPSTAGQWLSVLETTGLIILLEPFFENLGKRLIKAPKLYFRDTGLLGFLMGLSSPEAVEASPLRGALWETWVLQQILAEKANTHSPASVCYYRDAGGTEVDFVLDLDGRVRLVEAKWAEVIQDTKLLKPLKSVRALLGDRAASEHWIAARPHVDHGIPGEPGIRVIDAGRPRRWLTAPNEGTRSPAT